VAQEHGESAQYSRGSGTRDLSGVLTELVKTAEIWDFCITKFGKLQEVAASKRKASEITPATGHKSNKKSRSDDRDTPRSGSKDTQEAGKTCATCNKAHKGDCRLKDHPDACHKGHFVNSDKYPIYKALGHESLLFGKKLDNGKLVEYSTKGKDRDNSRKEKDSKGKPPYGPGKQAAKDKGKFDESYAATSLPEPQPLEEEAYDTTGSLMQIGIPAATPGTRGRESHSCEDEQTAMDVEGIDHPDADKAHDVEELLSREGLLDPNDGSMNAEIMLRDSQAGQANGVMFKPCTVLIDTQSKPFNFCSCRVRDLLVRHGGKVENVGISVEIGPSKWRVTERVRLTLRITNELLNVKNEILTVDALVLPMRHDIIIGRETIREKPLIQKLLFSELVSDEVLDEMAITIKARYAERDARRNTAPPKQRSPFTPWNRAVPILMALREAIPDHHAGDREANPDQFGDEEPTTETPHMEREVELPATIEGDEELQQDLRRLCARYADCFHSGLNKEPASVPPMELRVDESWYSQENRKYARPQGPAKQKEVDTQCGDMKDSGVIRFSKASAYSQVLLVPKPDGTWRFCIDFRRLNAATRAEVWPLPNIEDMLQSIGRQRPKYFGKFDLSKSYFQFALSESSKHYTAFITTKALYEWNRVPMGLSGAGAYVQRTMATIVLAGLVHICAEVFMDDILFWGSTREEYLANAEKVLQRLRKFKLTCNPKKCAVGLSSVEYVGHVIDAGGTTFHRERLQEVIDFDRPATKGELKSFLGMANYFREHIPNASEAPALLQTLLPNYAKKQQRHSIQWTDETLAAFEQVKRDINDAQKLFFIDYDDPNAEIHLFTDASDTGIGAHLVQIVHGKPRTIALMSRTLHAAQRNYSTVEKECLAIVEALKKFAYLIENVHFRLHTDHANLAHIRDTGSGRVLRWKLEIQAFDFEPCFIKGVLNTIADYMSRNKKAKPLEQPEPDITVTDLATLDLHVPVTNLDTLNLPQGRKLPTQSAEAVTVPEEEKLNYLFSAIDTSLIRPTTQQLAIIKGVHNAVAGHNGVEATLLRLKEAGHTWRYMRPMVKQYIKECDTCAKASTRATKPVATGGFTLSGTKLMQDIAVDFLGPFPKDACGREYICVIIDTCSRWVELSATHSNDALGAVSALMQWFGRFGLPNSLRSDRGAAFVNELIQALLEELNIDHHITVANSHEENGMVEAANREVRRYLKAIMYDRRVEKQRWADLLPLAQRIQNSMVKEMTGYKPSTLLFAGARDLDAQIFPTVAGKEARTPLTDTSWEEWLRQQRAFQQAALETTAARIKDHESKHQQEDNGQRTEFPVGTWVLRDWPKSSHNKGKPDKHVLEREGPFRVDRFKGQTYWLFDPRSGKILQPCNIHLLSAFVYDPATTDPAAIRNKDDREHYEVEKIEGHEGSFQKKRSLYFKVKWVDHETRTVEPWAHLIHNEALHQYLRDIGKPNQIHKAHR
jgi:transposase InsO family protein